MYSLNTQPAEKPVAGESLDVVNIWRTIQGEGPFAGRAAVFVRLAGCNLQCPSCDTDYTSRRMTWDVCQLVGEVQITASPPCGGMPAPIRLVVLTGGEPLRQQITPFVKELLTAGFEVQIETNGTIFQELPYGNRNMTIVCSPKAPRLAPRLAPLVNAYKYVLDHRYVNYENGLPLDILGDPTRAPAYPPDYFPRDRVYLQPLDAKDTAENILNEAAVKASCLRFGWRLGLQLHKIFNLE